MSVDELVDRLVSNYGGTREQVLESFEWIRDKPPAMIELMRRFPPACEVAAKPGVELLAPAPGRTGRVNSYFEHGALGVIARPKLGPACRRCEGGGRKRVKVPSGMRAVDSTQEGKAPCERCQNTGVELVSAECRPELLEVVGYHGFLPDDVDAVLALRPGEGVR